MLFDPDASEKASFFSKKNTAAFLWLLGFVMPKTHENCEGKYEF